MYIKPDEFSGRTKLFICLGILGLLVMQTWIFSTGYRMTADDLAFQDALLQGFNAAFQITHDNAIIQGRVGQYVSIPLVILGSYWADPLWVRVVYAGLYFLIGGLFCIYVAKLLKANIALFLFVLVIGLLNIGPVKWNHLPPTAYPLLITVPMLMIISAKLWQITTVKNSSNVGIAKKVVYLLVMSSAMLMNEFALLFGIGLLVLEYSTKLCFQSDGHKSEQRAWLNLRPYGLDILAILITLSLYVAYRITFPSQYDGNMPNGLHNGATVFKTLISHILASSSVLVLFDAQSKVLGGATLGQLLLAILFGATSGIVLFTIQKKIVVNTRLWPVIAGSFCYAICASLPNAITQKYQDWCFRGVCIYIDSRISYFGLILALGLLMLLVMKIAQRHQTIAFGLRIATSALIGLLASYTYLNNQQVRAGMYEYTLAWERAKTYACQPDTDPANDPNLLLKIDPSGLVVFHPNYPAKSYWLNYMNYYKAAYGCGGVTQ